MTDMILFLGYLAGVIWAPKLVDRIWFWFMDINLDGYEPKFVSKNYDAVEMGGAELNHKKITLKEIILNRIIYAVAWFSSVLWIGGAGCLVGIVMAVVFGHKNVFIGMGVGVGTIIGAIYPFVFMARYCRNTNGNKQYAIQKLISRLGHKKKSDLNLVLDNRGNA